MKKKINTFNKITLHQPDKEKSSRFGVYILQT